MKALVFCAGLGTRLRPLTNECPKAMVLLNGVPLIGLQIQKLKKAGITEIVVNVHHYAELIKAYIRENDWGIPVHISDESDLLLDTGGGLKKAAEFLQSEEAFLVHNVDIFSDIDIEGFINKHKHANALATLAIRNRKTSRYLLFDDGFQLSGWKNIKTEEQILTSKKSTGLNEFAFSGIHVISSEIFDLLPEADHAYSIIPIYLELSKKYKIIGVPHNEDNWIDVGTPEKLRQAELVF